MLSVGVLRQPPQQQPLSGGVSTVIQVLEAVDASASAGSQRGTEKAWIKERLAGKRSVAERELQQNRDRELQQHQRLPVLQSSRSNQPSSSPSPAVRGRVWLRVCLHAESISSSEYRGCLAGWCVLGVHVIYYM